MRDERLQQANAVPAKLILADDHDLMRKGLRSVLESEPDLEIVGEAANGREAVELCRRLGPDLVLMDVRMPELDGLAATRVIKSEHPGIGVLVVTMQENPDYLLEALDAGAAGYVLKDATGDRLVSAVRRTLNGESPLNQELAMQVLRSMASKEREPSIVSRESQQTVPEGLTPREIEVLRLLAAGQTNQLIAQTLTISKGTVKVHVERIIRKLGVSDRTQAAVRAIQMGLVTPDSGGYPQPR